MPLPPKGWFRLAELATCWGVSVADLEDYALDELIELSVFVVNLPAEAGIVEIDRGVPVTAITDLPVLNGPQPLATASLLDLRRDGQAEVRHFRVAEPGTYLQVRSDLVSLVVRPDDLIVTREERERFERCHGLGTARDAAKAFWHSDDFTRVRLDGAEHKFGFKQAAVLQLLWAASHGEQPWLDGRQLLEDAGATSMRLIDLFKRRPVWRRLLKNDGNGRHRFNPELLPAETRRVRLFRRASSRAAEMAEAAVR
jgi:hypothetical protein